MSTSGSTNFTLVTNTIIEKAFNVLGVGSEGEPLTARMYEDGRLSLNLMVKSWGTTDHLWLRTFESVPLVASQAAYNLTTLLGAKPGRVLEVRRRTNDIDTPLTSWSREEYTSQSAKATDSIPVAFYYDPQLTTGTLYVWPRASASTAANTTLEMSVLRRIDDFNASNDNADLPQEWLQVLIWNLADDLEVEYPVNNDRLAAKITGKAAALKAQLESWDTEPDSLFMQPEDRW